MAFILNPYNVTLDLTDREDIKLSIAGCKGLIKQHVFGGKKNEYSEFVKRMEREFEDVHVMSVLNIAKEWGQNRRNLTIDEMVDIFSTSKVSKETV